MLRNSTLSLGGCLLAAVLTVGSASAQQTLVVDSSGAPGSQYTEISSALADAVTGDVVVVHAGSYDQFVVDKGIAVVADRSAGAVFVIGGARVENVPAGWPAVLSGLNFVPGHPSIELGLNVRNNTGSVHLDDLQRTGIYFPVSIESSDLVSVRECTFEGSSFTVTIADSAVHFDGSDVIGGAGTGTQGAALWCDNSTVHLGATNVVGGATIFFPGLETPGLHLVSGEVVLGASSTVAAGSSPNAPELALEAVRTEAGSLVLDHGVAVVPSGGAAPITGPAAVAHTVVPAVTSQGARGGEIFSADTLAPPGSTAVTFVSLPGTPSARPFGALWGTTPRVVIDIAPIDASGSRSNALPVPAGFPLGIAFNVQALVVFNGAAYYSTPTTGVVRL